MSSCNVCKKYNLSKIYSDLIKCNDCNHVFANLDLDENQIKKIYEETYFFGGEYINYLEDKKLIEKNAKLRLKIINKYLKNLGNKKLLEIGCAYGFFMNFVNNFFKKTVGFDVSKKSIEYAKKKFNLNVFHDDFINKNIEDKFDIVCMWDVISHLNNPDLYLKKINKLTNDDGILALTTGNIASFNARFSKQNWRLIHPPSHIHYFSKESIANILKNNGFEIIYFKHCGYYRSLKFMLLSVKFINKNFNWLNRFFDIFPILNIGIYLNMYDIMYVIAKKQRV